MIIKSIILANKKHQFKLWCFFESNLLTTASIAVRITIRIASRVISSRIFLVVISAVSLIVFLIISCAIFVFILIHNNLPPNSIMNDIFKKILNFIGNKWFYIFLISYN